MEYQDIKQEASPFEDIKQAADVALQFTNSLEESDADALDICVEALEYISDAIERIITETEAARKQLAQVMSSMQNMTPEQLFKSVQEEWGMEVDDNARTNDERSSYADDSEPGEKA